MKRSIISILVIALLLTALAGCSSRGNDETTGTTPPMDNGGNVTPEDNNGVVEDGNGIIGDAGSNGDRPNEGVLPEIGSDIEQGANDVIDGVGDAIEGNDNNAGSNNTNSDTGDNARGRMKTR